MKYSTTATEMQDTQEYRVIAKHYGTRTTRRSGVPLMQHIDRGLVILSRIGASRCAKRAFCLHPLLQGDADLRANIDQLADLTTNSRVVALVLEYRHIANAALSTRMIETSADIKLSPISEVNDMLIADKVQNRSDFLRHHRATHPRASELDRYFRLWLERLSIDEARYSELARE